MGRHTGWLAVLAIAGCGIGGDDAPAGIESPSSAAADNDGHDQLEVPVDGMEAQGQYLLGETLDGLGLDPGYHVNLTTDAVTADGSAVTVVFDGSASLRSGSHRGADPYFNGMVLTGAAGAKLRLTVARGGYDVAFYRLELRGPTGAWTDLCGGGDAVPLAGKWQRSGFHEHAPDRFSFACAGSVGYKCTVWSYLAGGDDTSLGWRAHQACTRMARADDCANGRSHTREGTRIKIYDFVGVTAPPPLHFDGVGDWPPNANRMFFEAAWSDGAHPASCLGRFRWQSLPTGPLCPDSVPNSPQELPDPRSDTNARYCDDLAWPDPGAMPTGALLFNESFYNDLELHVWANGTNLVSTVRGLLEQPIRQPFPNAGTFSHVARDGMLVRSLHGVDPAQFLEVHLYGKPGDLVVAAVAPPGFDDLGFEGYVRIAPTPRTIAFNLYFNAATHDYLSASTAPPGYALQSTIGYILPAEVR